ncbi:MAG: hypothetical protein JWM27_1621, partial [Gemmatimonadetes bacterium]|nr:hypothetical protein [Gemmatimonadota bacterium]
APPPAGTPGEWAAGVREARRPGISGTLTGLRSARQAGFDRVTLQFDGPRVPTYHVEYVPRPASQCASGQATQADGKAWLLVRLSSSRAHDDAGQVTVAAREQKPALPAVREVEITCDFEGEVALVVGVSDRRPYRVSELANPTRLVLDVQQ